MEEPTPTGQGGSWSKRLAILFTFLFVIFWSLGAFFFWILLALAFYFTFLAIYNSESVSIWFSNLKSSFQNPRQPVNPYQPSRPQVTPEQPTNVPARVLKVVRFFLFGALGMLAFFFFVGVFFGKNNETNEGQTNGEQSIEVGETAVDDDGSSFWNEKGNAAMGNERYDSAIFYYDKVLAIDPENTYGLYNKGLSYTLKQDYRRGNAFARQCVHFHPDYNPAWWLLGYNYDLMNNTDSAVYFLEKAYLADYNQPDFLQLMAEVYVKKDRRSNALEVYRKMVTNDTTRADIFRKMAELDPANADGYRRKANALESK